MSAQNGSFPIFKLFIIIVLFLVGWEARADAAPAAPAAAPQSAELIGLAVRSNTGTFLVKEEAMPLANVPVNFFALFHKNLNSEVQMHLSGPIQYSNRSVAEPYGLFEDIAFESLPAGTYELLINLVNARGLIEQSHVLKFTLSQAFGGAVTGSIVDVNEMVAMETVQ